MENNDIEDKDDIDDIEGDDDSDQEVWWGAYPLDAIFIRTENRTVGEVCRRIKNDRYIMAPDFQRDFIWEKKKQSRLIQSCLMRIPLPVFYLAENKEGKIIVVDGLQRLTTFFRYLNDDFGLTGLGDDASVQDKDGFFLAKKKFHDLPVNLQERLEDTQLTLYVLDSKAPERAKLDIFDRVNGGVPLNRQQMRNCLYQGPATKWLKDAAGSAGFIQATARKLNEKNMRDREVINRFCAFYLFGTAHYKGDMDTFMADALDKMNESGESDLEKMYDDFIFSMESNYRFASSHAFRKSFARETTKSVINISLFDAFSVNMVKLKGFDFNNESLVASLKRDLTELIKNNEFDDAITMGTCNKNKVLTRHQMTEDVLKKYIP